ncbi:MAG: type II toxin-antitoxin system VapC family toxin [Acidobacteriota bacterium]|nr:type II toxin-antitoxin system VapC family toxin [Acidobacteriota bacterium]
MGQRHVRSAASRGASAPLRGRGRGLKVLLDTHALLWAAQGRLRGHVGHVIEETADAVYVSAATIWEIEIKRALRRLRAPQDTATLVDASGFRRLNISYEHALEAGRLPPIHADPFDRMLVAQARLEGMTLATGDAQVRRYDVALLTVTVD